MRKHYANNQRLLDKVCYLSKPESKYADLFGVEIVVKHTFVYNPESKTAPETAKRWANTDTWDHKTRQYIKGPEPEFLERVNDPFSISIIDLDVRSEGGRAYKVIDDAGRCFDLREDQVLEVFKHTGILAGGKVPGQFVWGILGSQMRMVLVGGDLHTEMTAQAAALKDFKRNQSLGKTPTEGTLQFGHIYRKRDQSLHLFLGRVKVPDGDKSLFAFIKLPSKPSDHEGDERLDDDVNDNNWVVHARKERAIAQKWESLSWTERCQWAWRDSYEWYYKQYKDAEHPDYSEDIVLMSSPKFEAEDGQDIDFATTIRDNAESKHKYVNGKGDDIAEKRWERDHNGGRIRQRNFGYHPGSGYTNEWYRISDSERKQREAETQAAAQQSYVATRTEFQRRLEWQP